MRKQHWCWAATLAARCFAVLASSTSRALLAAPPTAALRRTLATASRGSFHKSGTIAHLPHGAACRRAVASFLAGGGGSWRPSLTRRRLLPSTGPMSMNGEARFSPLRPTIRKSHSTSDDPEGLPPTVSGFGLPSENALIVLNTDCVTTPLFRRFWNISGLRICADGGANQLHDNLGPSEIEDFIPHYISGDLDSVRLEVATFYEKLGTRVMRDPDQDTNDLEKCLQVIKSGGGGGRVSSKSTDVNVFVVGALGLRFDHCMANIHMLFKYSTGFRRLILLGTESMAFLLQPGQHVIRPDTEIEGPICGLLPVSGKCRSATTTGLRWNLEGQSLEFGGLVSTSNEFALPHAQEVVITVENSDPLIWTTAIKDAWQKQLPQR